MPHFPLLDVYLATSSFQDKIENPCRFNKQCYIFKYKSYKVHALVLRHLIISALQVLHTVCGLVRSAEPIPKYFSTPTPKTQIVSGVVNLSGSTQFPPPHRFEIKMSLLRRSKGLFLVDTLGWLKKNSPYSCVCDKNQCLVA